MENQLSQLITWLYLLYFICKYAESMCVCSADTRHPV